jgi:hypothetical protein
MFIADINSAFRDQVFLIAKEMLESNEAERKMQSIGMYIFIAKKPLPMFVFDFFDRDEQFAGKPVYVGSDSDK